MFSFFFLFHNFVVKIFVLLSSIDLQMSCLLLMVLSNLLILVLQEFTGQFFLSSFSLI